MSCRRKDWYGTAERIHANAQSILLRSWHSEDGHWYGELSSSALSTATAVGALAMLRQESSESLIRPGLDWLARHQNTDGGWGDTILSRSNISTTLLCWSCFALSAHERAYPSTIDSAEAWIRREAGSLNPAALVQAVNARYGGDRTFSAPILTMCVLAGRMGPSQTAWQYVHPLPYEVAALPQRLLGWARLPVVSYALPALIAIGQVRFQHAPPSNPLLRVLRQSTRRSTLQLLQRIQPGSGGYLEAVPLTSFVLLSLGSCGLKHHSVISGGLQFLHSSVRRDGSWPIDTNLATWVTTLAVNAGVLEAPEHQPKAAQALDWLLKQQYLDGHPYTQAPPGGWAWTDLPGGVPDADDTAGAVLALRRLGSQDPLVRQRAAAGITWLMAVQNRDGGIPTFCRGWGKLPFDRSSPDLTAHALLAWHSWLADLPPPLARKTTAAIRKALRFLLKHQEEKGTWRPLWFGNELAPDESNPTYGTARVVMALSSLAHDYPESRIALIKGCGWLLSAQNPDGGWGASPHIPSSIEETAVALDALARAAACGYLPVAEWEASITEAVRWLESHTNCGSAFPPAPIGLYFARLWYFEALYPILFTVSALQRLLRLDSGKIE